MAYASPLTEGAELLTIRLAGQAPDFTSVPQPEAVAIGFWTMVIENPPHDLRGGLVSLVIYVEKSDELSGDDDYHKS